MAIGRAPQTVLARHVTCSSGAGNGEGLELDFDGIVAGREAERQEKRRRKRESSRISMGS
jgi:hypothetical protein